MKGYRKKLGQWGEELAENFFRKDGFKLVAKNWRAQGQKMIGEIDLICEKEKEIVFIEVKTRTTSAFGYGEGAVDWSKKEKIKKAINKFLFQNGKYQDYAPRFDILVVEIFSLTPQFVHFENVELG